MEALDYCYLAIGIYLAWKCGMLRKQRDAARNELKKLKEQK